MSEGVQEAVIVDWKPKSPFGFAQTGDERIFLHITQFIERERWPEAGDRVSFVMGTDPNGRPCAQKIVLLASASLLGWQHILQLLMLLALPAYALTEFVGLISPWWVLYFCTFTSAVAAMHLWFDKRFAITERSRVPEATLHLFELMGGWPGSFLAQKLLRHKVSKRDYQGVYWAIVMIHQLFALDLIFGGLLYNGLHSLAGGS